MAVNDGYLRTIPADTSPNDGRAYDPLTPSALPVWGHQLSTELFRIVQGT